MGLKSLLSRVGGGLLRATPKIQRSTAHLASAFGNRAPLANLENRDQNEFARDVTLRNLERQDLQDERQAAQDRLAAEREGRDKTAFENQQELQRRQLAITPKTYEEALQRKKDEDAAALQNRLAETTAVEDIKSTTPISSLGLPEGALPPNLVGRLPQPPSSVNLGLGTPEENAPVAFLDRAAKDEYGSRRVLKTKTPTSVAGIRFAAAQGDPDAIEAAADIDAQNKERDEQLWRRFQLGLNARVGGEGRVDEDRDATRRAQQIDQATKMAQVISGDLWIALTDEEKKQKIAAELATIVAAAGGKAAPAPTPNLTGGGAAVNKQDPFGIRP